VGAACASGDLLVFIDSDVVVHPETIGSLGQILCDNKQLSAVIGTYDETPAASGFVSQYRNLLHSYFHSTGRSEASTFWTGCGGIRRSEFREFGGFAVDRPYVRDIELGVRMSSAGRRILLAPWLRVTHLKRWTLGTMVKTDVFSRGVNWTEIILRAGSMPNDLNLRTSERVCVTALYLMMLVAGAASGGLASGWKVAAALGALAIVYLAACCQFIRFLRRVRDARFALRSLPVHVIYHLSCGLGFLAGLARYYASSLRADRPAAEVELEVGPYVLYDNLDSD